MATCYDRYYRRYYTCNSRWSSWGRWVALVVILVVAFLLFFICACISQSRRRKAGHKPFYGTGWTYKVPGGGNPPQYTPNSNQNQQYQTPPNYNQYGNNNTSSNVPQGGYYGGAGAAPQGEAATYFGGQRSDVEMQRPGEGVYDNGYAPPQGPPPAKVR